MNIKRLVLVLLSIILALAMLILTSTIVNALKHKSGDTDNPPAGANQSTNLYLPIIINLQRIGTEGTPIKVLFSPIVDVGPLIEAGEQIEQDLHVFVHLVDENGHIIAQADGQPADWTRPTTGWAPGEFVIDRHTLSIPGDLALDAHALHVGLYDPDTGERLPVEGGDFARLPLGR